MPPRPPLLSACLAKLETLNFQRQSAQIGTIDSAAVYPREIIRGALILGAASIVVFHNHPSGDPEPSLCDREITKDIVFACKVMQIRLLDHVIMGKNCYYSFADKGLIEDYGLCFLSMNR